MQDIPRSARSEKANPQADVSVRRARRNLQSSATEGLIDPYRPTGVLRSPEAHHPADLWYGTYMTPEVIAYNTDIVTEAQAPKDWDDVLAPQWKGKIIIRDPVASGSMRAIWGAVLARSIARTGSTAQGW